ncbi:hypothetical protein CRG98_044703 [Punica granatum]|uniref:Uncharacterized protein n=1 Tax=Punica granatum TaxID=22663 RepID=A0A2I0HUG3_PUNGR|nr:hypothetical protein CRG98_044703 [Punica granatum]
MLFIRYAPCAYCKPSGTSRLLFFAPCNPPGKTPRTPQVYWVGGFEPCCSFGMRPVHIANLRGSVPFGYVPTTFLLRGPSPSGTSRLLFCSGVRPLWGSVPFGYVPTTFLHRGPSRLHFCSGVRPLRVRPSYFSAQGSVPFGYVPTIFPCTMQPAGHNASHLANLSGKTPRTPQVHWVGAFEPCCSFGMRPVHIETLRVRPDYFSAQGSVPFGYVPTTFLLRGHPLRVCPDYFSTQGPSRL